ncbi:MAG: HipA domain-containing protein, partial [Deltaproteobacteria bacterium]
MRELLVSSNSLKVGILSVNEGLWSFRYAETWREWPLSPQFPVLPEIFIDRHDNRQVEWFFDNLLPEGRVRQLIAARERIDSADTWAFLLRHGQDMAGAISLQAIDDMPESVGELIPLSVEELQAKILESHGRQLPLMAAWDEIRMSLAGAQEKLGLLITADGSLFLPKGNAASSHIVKPDNVSPDFPYCPANEFFCMSLARVMKLPVPEVDLLHLPAPLYCVRRYDRIETGGSVNKLHQIDLCQALGVPPSKKYESDGGLGLQELLSLLGGSLMERPILAIHTALQWLIFNYLIGNLDAHAKNIAFLLQSPKARVAPLYDLLSVEVYLP